jgi:hypothetical protein
MKVIRALSREFVMIRIRRTRRWGLGIPGNSWSSVALGEASRPRCEPMSRAVASKGSMTMMRACNRTGAVRTTRATRAVLSRRAAVMTATMTG